MFDLSVGMFDRDLELCKLFLNVSGLELGDDLRIHVGHTASHDDGMHELSTGKIMRSTWPWGTTIVFISGVSDALENLLGKLVRIENSSRAAAFHKVLVFMFTIDFPPNLASIALGEEAKRVGFMAGVGVLSLPGVVKPYWHW